MDRKSFGDKYVGPGANIEKHWKRQQHESHGTDGGGGGGGVICSRK